jgi:hypothetical protein
MSAASSKVQPDVIGGDRRTNRRYSLQLRLRWKVVRRGKVLSSGTGQTLDLSTGGICFDAGQMLPTGVNVEVSIIWPVLLRDASRMQLLIVGKVVRCDGSRIALRASRREFRTMGLVGGHLEQSRGAEALQ